MIGDLVGRAAHHRVRRTSFRPCPPPPPPSVVVKRHRRPDLGIRRLLVPGPPWQVSGLLRGYEAGPLVQAHVFGSVLVSSHSPACFHRGRQGKQACSHFGSGAHTIASMATLVVWLGIAWFGLVSPRPRDGPCENPSEHSGLFSLGFWPAAALDPHRPNPHQTNPDYALRFSPTSDKPGGRRECGPDVVDMPWGPK